MRKLLREVAQKMADQAEFDGIHDVGQGEVGHVGRRSYRVHERRSRRMGRGLACTSLKHSLLLPYRMLVHSRCYLEQSLSSMGRSYLIEPNPRDAGVDESVAVLCLRHRPKCW